MKKIFLAIAALFLFAACNDTSDIEPKAMDGLWKGQTSQEQAVFFEIEERGEQAFVTFYEISVVPQKGLLQNNLQSVSQEYKEGIAEVESTTFTINPDGDLTGTLIEAEVNPDGFLVGDFLVFTGLDTKGLPTYQDGTFKARKI